MDVKMEHLMVINTLLSLFLISSCYSYTIDTQECDCDILKFTTKNPYILRKYENKCRRSQECGHSGPPFVLPTSAK